MVTAVVLGLAVPASASLPPIYQRTAELRAVVDALDGSGWLDLIGEVVAIEYVGVDRYEVRGAECWLIASIVSLPQEEDIAGPRQFLVEVGEPECGSVDADDVKRPVR
jgi:hypothetical protein